MAIKLRYISIILRIDAIEAHYEGGWPAFYENYRRTLGINAYYDEHLFCLSLRKSSDMRMTMKKLEAKGMVTRAARDGEAPSGHDCCVFIERRIHLPCDWIAVLPGQAVHLRETAPGAVVSLRQFRPVLDPDA